MALTGGGVSPENFCPLSWGKKFRGHRLSTHCASVSEGLDNRPEGGKTKNIAPLLKGHPHPAPKIQTKPPDQKKIRRLAERFG